MKAQTQQELKLTKTKSLTPAQKAKIQPRLQAMGVPQELATRLLLCSAEDPSREILWLKRCIKDKYVVELLKDGKKVTALRRKLQDAQAKLDKELNKLSDKEDYVNGIIQEFMTKPADDMMVRAQIVMALSPKPTAE